VSGVFIGLGGNLASPIHGPPRAVLEAAVAALPERGLFVLRRSRWYRSSPVPPSDQPDYLNAVIEVALTLPPEPLLDLLLAVETAFGRTRGEPGAARILDLDLLAFGDRVIHRPGILELPHPRMHARAFVLKPLAELAPEWRHPVLKRPIAALIAALVPDQTAVPWDDDR
jgi:2-amino-4-hydroxy-6-hydroxymethyldihydropteridine diphosphokinase